VSGVLTLVLQGDANSYYSSTLAAFNNESVIQALRHDLACIAGTTPDTVRRPQQGCSMLFHDAHGPCFISGYNFLACGSE
jgi:hypothetical protein